MGQTQPFIQISIRFAPTESFYLCDDSSVMRNLVLWGKYF